MKEQPAKDVQREIRALSATVRATCLVDGLALPPVGLAQAGSLGKGVRLEGAGWNVYNYFLICSLSESEARKIRGTLRVEFSC